MKYTLRLICSLGLILLFSNFAVADQKSDGKKIDQARQDLNYGYANLYDNLKSFAWTDEVMMIKKEAEEVNHVGKDVGETCGKLVDKLKSLTHDYPNLKLDEMGQPKVLADKKKDLKKEKLKKFLPLTGKTGVDFERTLLIATQGGIDDQRLLSEVMLGMETDKGLRDYLSTVHSEMERLYNRVDRLLNARYYKHNMYKRKK